MPLPHPPGYRPRLQTRLDRRRIALAGVLFSLFAALLMVLGRRAAAVPGSSLPVVALERALVVVLVAGACGAWGDLMRQLASLSASRDRLTGDRDDGA